jgi:hypothetical protein
MNSPSIFLAAKQLGCYSTLAERFPQLKSLIVDLGYYDSGGVTKNSQIKYTPNLTHARSVFRVDCPNQGCVGGDFDLTDELAKAVTQHRTTVAGEMACQGWQSKTTIDTVHCHNILRYTLNAVYEEAELAATSPQAK